MISNPIVKICGLSSRKTVDAAIHAGAQWIGFVYFAPSPRHLTIEASVSLANYVRGRAKIVSLSVNANDKELDTIANQIKPDILQFHGKETPERVSEAKKRYNLPVMKAIGISTLDDLDALSPYLNVADHILLDAKPPKNAILPGGNGATFDWDILKKIPDHQPYMLSGGLDPDNVIKAISKAHPFGVDVSSGVESAPGVKDILKIEHFITAAKSAISGSTH